MQPAATRPSTFARTGMVATPHPLASESGRRVLAAGGSAVDAAVAANAVLAVAYPHMAGLGGDGFWLVHDPAEGGVAALDASGPAARAATRDAYRDAGHADAIPLRGGPAALTVPGAVDGWREAHARYGRLPWRDLFEDAIRLARDGVPVARSLAGWLARDRDLLQRDPATARTFLPGGRAPREGEPLVQPALAVTLERLAGAGARNGFYEGAAGERFAAGVAAAGSPLVAEDLAAYRASWTTSITTTYRDATVHELPPPTQGFAALQILNLLDGYDVAAWGDASADLIHHAAEAVKLAYADRDAWLTDPRFVDIPVHRFVEKSYAAARRARIDPTRAARMDDVPPGIPFTTDARRAAQGPAPGDTCAFSAVDENGLVASVIQSVFHEFGAGFVAGDTGILAQNRGSAFSLDDAHPNRLAPGKRPFHTLTPGLAFHGDAVIAFGTMGGEGQPQTHAAFLTRLLDFGLGVQAAIDAPRWRLGRSWGAPTRDLAIEGRVPDAVVRELARRGQPVRVLPDFSEDVGHAQAIRVDPARGVLEGGADPRGDGVVRGL